MKSGMYLHVDDAPVEIGAEVRTSEDGTSLRSQWRVESIGDRVYTLQNMGSSRYLKLADGKTEKGSNVWTLDNLGSSSSLWRLQVVPNGDGTAHVVQNSKNSLFLNVGGSSAESEAKVQVWDKPGSLGSLWEMIGSDSCHDAVIGELCFNDAIWAKEYAINMHPEWYPGLTSESSFADFQAHLHFCFWNRCPLPCASTSQHSCGMVDRVWNDASCLDAAEGSRCHTEILWAKQHGVHKRPEQYLGLSEDSSEKQFQARLYKGQQAGLADHGCAEPCCHDTVPGELCHEDAVWAMMHGINDPVHQHVYPPSLTNTSDFAEFQAYLHLCYPDRCPEPCEDTVVQANHQGGTMTPDCTEILRY
jgi:hypothetical protein